MGCSNTVCKKYFPPFFKSLTDLLDHRPHYTLQCTNGAHIEGLRPYIVTSVLGGVDNSPFFVLGRRKTVVGRDSG